jgi:hypothetical protein
MGTACISKRMLKDADHWMRHEAKQFTGIQNEILMHSECTCLAGYKLMVTARLIHERILYQAVSPGIGCIMATKSKS